LEDVGVDRRIILKWILKNREGVGQDREQLWALVNTMMGHQKASNFLTS
jgi:hypothetical protein